MLRTSQGGPRLFTLELLKEQVGEEALKIRSGLQA